MFQPQGVLCKDIDELLSKIGVNYELKNKVEYKNKSRYVIKYINVPCSFDIEVTSVWVRNHKALNEKEVENIKDLENKFNLNLLSKEERSRVFKILTSIHKESLMYIWQFGIDGYVIYGRTWVEFIDAMKKVVKHFNLDYETKRLPIYIHNESYEFQFIRSMFNWVNIFAREKRSPMKALTDVGLEFRCSYILSGYSLQKTCENLTKYKVSKKVGDLDYKVLRSPLTKLTDKELDYCIYDVIGVMNYIKEEMEHYNNDITKIPMTKTGKVREYCRNICLSNKKYRKLIEGLTVELNEYDMLKRAFQGGYTHSSLHNTCETFVNVYSRDFTSSYPAVMCSCKFPMGKGKKVKISSIEQLIALSNDYCVLFDVHFEGLKPKFEHTQYLAQSKCWGYDDKNNKRLISELYLKNNKYIVDNGKIIKAEHCITTITDVDFAIVNSVYEWDKVSFNEAYIYDKAYLPKEFINCILDFYESKTKLKNVVGKEAEYQSGKENVNSCYGMSVTDIINDIITFDDDWHSTDGDKESQLKKYNKSATRFLYYPWGVWITAYARRNLWMGILELKEDFIYCDTDSLKYVNDDKHTTFFNKYNNWIVNELTKMCNYYNIDVNRIKPKTVKGVEKPLGVWDDESVDTPLGHIYAKRFKTVGAKRYLVEHWNKDNSSWELECTIAGVNKKKTSEWFNKQDKPFDLFTDMLTIPKEYADRPILTYIDPQDAIDFDMIDCQGNKYHASSHSGIHFDNTDYNLTLTPYYLSLIEEGRSFIC